MTTRDADILAALDWKTIGCQCTLHDCPATATHQLELHAIDDCRAAGTNPFGNVIALLCEGCAAILAAHAKLYTRRLAAFGRPFCLTCGSPVSQRTDLVRAITELAK